MALRRAALVAAVGAATACLSSSARAQDSGPEALLEAHHVQPPGGTSLLDRPHTMAVIEAGVLALPTAPISPALQGGSTPFGSFGHGDATMVTGIRTLYRATPDWAFGAGILVAPFPTSDRGTVTGTTLDRTHARGYFGIDAEVRYFPLRFSWVQAWVGLTGGMVVIGDRYDTNSGIARPTILGQREVTIRTEGASIGAQIGGDWMFADRWIAGLAIRSQRWILPNERARSTLGDSATLVGIVEALEVSLNIGYRLPF